MVRGFGDHWRSVAFTLLDRGHWRILAEEWYYRLHCDRIHLYIMRKIEVGEQGGNRSLLESSKKEMMVAQTRPIWAIFSCKCPRWSICLAKNTAS